MRTLPTMCLAALAVASFASTFAAPGQETAIIGSAKEIKWGPPAPSLPAGAKMVVLAGDPAGSGLVTIRLQMPAGYTIPPHWHPTDEHVTVLSGSLSLGMGDKLDEAQAKTLTAGGYVVAPAKMHHFAMSKTGAVIQVNLNGPFAITYVNPADDPRKNATSSKTER